MWELDKSSPDTSTLAKLSILFGTTTDYLLGLTDDPTDYDKDQEENPVAYSVNSEIAKALDNDPAKIRAFKEAQAQDQSQTQEFIDSGFLRVQQEALENGLDADDVRMAMGFLIQAKKRDEEVTKKKRQK